METKQNGFSSIIVISAIAVFLVVGGFGMWYYVVNQPVRPNSNGAVALPDDYATSQKGPVVSAGQEAAVPARDQNRQDADDIAGWQTYRNEKCGYEIKYPAEYKPVEDNGGGVNFTTSATAKCHEQGGATESMCDETNAGPNIGCVLAKDFLNGVPNLQQYVTPGPTDTFTPRTVNVGNLTGTEVEGSGMGGVYKDIYLQKGDYIIVFDILRDGNDAGVATFDKMIATFEFVE